MATPAPAFEEALRNELNNSGIGMAGGFLSTYSVQAPQYPYCIFTDVTQRPVYGHQGAANLIQRTYQLSVFGISQSQVIYLVDQLRKFFQGFRGTMTDPTPSGRSYTVASVMYQGQHYAYEADTRLHMFAADFKFQYNE
jgi:hypothetical protein